MFTPWIARFSLSKNLLRYVPRTLAIFGPTIACSYLTAAPQATFQVIPSVSGYEKYASNPSSLSISGKWVAGTLSSGTNFRAFRWTVGEGVDILEGPKTPIAMFNTMASGISDSGKVVVGTSTLGSNNAGLTWLGNSLVTPSPLSILNSLGTGISSNGQTVVGWAWPAPHLHQLGLISVGDNLTMYERGTSMRTRMHSVSRNGRYVVATDENGSYLRDLVTKSDQTLQYGTPTAAADNGMAVGYSGAVPVQWNGGVVTQIPSFAGGKPIGKAFGVSDDGEYAVGMQINGKDAEEAFFWVRKGNVTYALKELLNRNGAAIPANVTLKSATAVRSYQGVLSFCGTANNGSDRAFVATLRVAKLTKRK